MTTPCSTGAARHAPATLRNREPLLAVLREHLPRTGRVLEIGSGTGEHAGFFATAFPDLRFAPTDLGDENLDSIRAHTAALGNVEAPRVLDARDDGWNVGTLDAMLAINVIHISPPETLTGLMRGAGAYLRAGGVLVTYGPYRVDGAHTAPSNARFEEWLHSLDPTYGVRDLEDVVAQAADHGLSLRARVAMPANNFSLVFERT